MDAAPLAQRCLHTMKLQARCKFTSPFNTSRPISTRRLSHSPARRKGRTVIRPAAPPLRPFSTSRPVQQDPRAEPPPTSPSAPPPTAPKPSIMGNLTKKLRTQGSSHGDADDGHVPAKRPLAEQLDIFNWDIMDMMGSDPRKRPPPSALSRGRGDGGGKDDDEEAIDQEALYNNLAGAAYRQSDMPKVSLRLKPALGRTQQLDLTRNVDLTTAFRRVERKCTDNSVKMDARNQRIYVRRGQRRKDDRRRRWRALFKEGFLHECARIRRMKAQGW